MFPKETKKLQLSHVLMWCEIGGSSNRPEVHVSFKVVLPIEFRSGPCAHRPTHRTITGVIPARACKGALCFCEFCVLTGPSVWLVLCIVFLASGMYSF